MLHTVGACHTYSGGPGLRTDEGHAQRDSMPCRGEHMRLLSEEECRLQRNPRPQSRLVARSRLSGLAGDTSAYQSRLPERVLRLPGNRVRVRDTCSWA